MKTTHTKQNKDSKKLKSNQETWSKKRIFIDSIIVFFVAISPFVAYSYLAAPEGETWDIGVYTFTKNGFSSVNIAIWLYVSKLIPLYLLIFWFITCKHWWYHIILVPITLFGFQLFAALSKGSNIIDENESLWVIIVLMVIAPIVYLMRLRLYDKYVLGIDLQKIDAELEEYERKEKEAENKIEIK
ncbi:hypothetical protein IMCC3317_03700 [Kordia antarctica]|uniref:Uncharacterized protein n=1 Tax=Kordia antarctica TaxID=1218801 RepID=A0A7L4ZGH5_9FLAO|nr:hypothetical protein [Kordia antarctica]QHI35024.1 hypothetical protein IMCC3317_03700 [Kordia antarctica]